jgi:hypothetical protein
LRPALLLAPLLLGACTAGWPTGAYLDAPEPQAVALVPVIGECLSNLLPPGAAISLPPSNDASLASALADQIPHSGLTVASDGHGQPISYSISLMDGGLLMRVAASRGACSQFFALAADGPRPGGPMMVQLP